MADPWYGKVMETADVESFLNEQAAGVLCLAKDNRAYGIPVAFAYDGNKKRALFDLGFAPESKKRSFIEASGDACLTTYAWSGPHSWQSAVLEGSLEALSDDDVDDDVEAWFYTVAKDIDVEDRGLKVQWYELRASELSGRYFDTDS